MSEWRAEIEKEDELFKKALDMYGMGELDSSMFIPYGSGSAASTMDERGWYAG